MIAAEYELVKGRTPEELAENVNALLQEGDYIVQGGVKVAGATWVQALVMPAVGVY